MSDSVRPHRWQPTRLRRPWDSPGENTGVGCYFLLQCMKVKRKVKLFSRVQLFATPWTAAYQAPPSMGFSRQEYWWWGAIVSNTDVSFLGVQKEVFNPFFKIYIFPFYTRGRIQISLYLAFYPNLCFGYFLKSVCRKLCQMCRGV